MRLIDADLLIDRMGFYSTQHEREENAGQISTLEDFDNMPTAYDVDKVVEQLHSLKKYSNPYDSYYDEASYRATEYENSVTNKVIDDVVKIVKAGGIDEI